MNLRDIAAPAGDRVGVMWSLDTSSDLNANLVQFGTGEGFGVQDAWATAKKQEKIARSARLSMKHKPSWVAMEASEAI